MEVSPANGVPRSPPLAMLPPGNGAGEPAPVRGEGARLGSGHPVRPAGTHHFDTAVTVKSAPSGHCSSGGQVTWPKAGR